MNIFLVANGKVSNIKQISSYIIPNLVICVNGGANKAIKNGIQPHIIIGDTDSLTKKNIPKNATIIKYPRKKDKSDLELALDYILSNYKNFKLFCFGIIGNRIDHTLANIYSLFRINFPTIVVNNKQTLLLFHRNYLLESLPTKTKLSVISFSDFSILHREGFQYSGTFQIPLLSSLGISNFSTNKENFLKCLEGKVLIVVYKDILSLNVKGII